MPARRQIMLSPHRIWQKSRTLSLHRQTRELRLIMLSSLRWWGLWILLILRKSRGCRVGMMGIMVMNEVKILAKTLQMGRVDKMPALQDPVKQPLRTWEMIKMGTLALQVKLYQTLLVVKTATPPTKIRYQSEDLTLLQALAPVKTLLPQAQRQQWLQVA